MQAASRPCGTAAVVPSVCMTLQLLLAGGVKSVVDKRPCCPASGVGCVQPLFVQRLLGSSCVCQLCPAASASAVCGDNVTRIARTPSLRRHGYLGVCAARLASHHAVWAAASCGEPVAACQRVLSPLSLHTQCGGPVVSCGVTCSDHHAEISVSGVHAVERPHHGVKW